jgi:exopolyphosphatase/guanosine-5'-triphosphate,3'-diphosphate pyrophosphatase
MHLAVLDLGTNTFNLVVARKSDTGGVEFVHSSKLPVKLGEGGITQGLITQAAFKRGIDAIVQHQKILMQYKPQKILAFGTSALRTAKNGPDFLEQIRKIAGIGVEIITGDREAELIYYGVRQTIKMDTDKYLILDIGGGSNELIIADGTTIFWKRSYNLGIARLLSRFNPSDPITPREIDKIESYLDSELSELYYQVDKHLVTRLLGASGSFETFVAMIREDDDSRVTQLSVLPHITPVSTGSFNMLHNRLIRSTSGERAKMKGLEPMRIEMIVLASLFVKFIVERLGITQIIQSNFSLKEGAIYEMIKD